MTPYLRMTMYPRIMLVQDDRELYERLRQLQESPDDQLVWAKHEGDALELFQSSEFDVLILDLDLPAGTAWNTLADLVTLDPDVRVILLSSSPGWHSLAESVGADAVLDKPIDVPTLIRLLKDFCDRPGHRNRLRVDPDRTSQARLADTNFFYLQWLKERRERRRAAREVYLPAAFETNE
jgi:CheY-like chemotaxis protein